MNQRLRSLLVTACLAGGLACVTAQGRPVLAQGVGVAGGSSAVQDVHALRVSPPPELVSFSPTGPGPIASFPGAFVAVVVSNHPSWYLAVRANQEELGCAGPCPAAAPVGHISLKRASASDTPASWVALATFDQPLLGCGGAAAGATCADSGQTSPHGDTIGVDARLSGVGSALAAGASYSLSLTFTLF